MMSGFIILVILAALIFGVIKMYGFDKKQEEVSRRLVSFIAENYDELASGATLDYRGTPISRYSRLTRYRYCYSCLIMTSSHASGIYIDQAVDFDDEAVNAKRTCQLITITLGWWGIPWGIINSIRFLYLNGERNGTNDDTVGDLMQRIADTVQTHK